MGVNGPKPLDGMSNPGDERIVLITAPNEDVGRQLARAMVGARLAACVNVLPGLTSVYRWQGQVHEDPEVLLVVKTRGEVLAGVEALLRDAHPYDVPECVAIRPDEVEARYLRWWGEQLMASDGEGAGGAANDGDPA